MLATLNQLHQDGRLAALKREKIDSDSIRGFVSAVSTDLVVISIVDSHCNFDGIVVIRVEDVTYASWDNERLQAWTRVLQESPSSPASVKHIDLSSWESVVRSVAVAEQIVSFHREHVDDSSWHCGINVQIDGEHLVADDVSVRGTIDGQFVLQIDDLTRIDVGGGYELALWRMIQTAKRVDPT